MLFRGGRLNADVPCSVEAHEKNGTAGEGQGGGVGVEDAQRGGRGDAAADPGELGEEHSEIPRGQRVPPQGIPVEGVGSARGHQRLRAIVHNRNPRPPIQRSQVVAQHDHVVVLKQEPRLVVVVQEVPQHGRVRKIPLHPLGGLRDGSETTLEPIGLAPRPEHGVVQHRVQQGTLRRIVLVGGCVSEGLVRDEHLAHTVRAWEDLPP
mmetsp:Transcript_32299/g.77445  ORF Transcript_32299/g.77445 Transcript_32299/m.77445 type:complete len:207 (-) Transcript_32299:702-1322(-)